MDRIKSICIEEELCQSHDGSLEQILKQMLSYKIIDIIRVSARLMHMAQCGGCRQPYRNSRNAVVKRSVHEICSRGIVIV